TGTYLPRSDPATRLPPRRSWRAGDPPSRTCTLAAPSSSRNAGTKHPSRRTENNARRPSGALGEGIGREDRIVADQGLGLTAEELEGQPVGRGEGARAVGLPGLDVLPPPLHLVQQGARRLRVSQAMVGHRQDEPVLHLAFVSPVPGGRLLQPPDRRVELAGAV